MSDRLTPALEALTWAAFAALPVVVAYQAVTGQVGPDAVRAAFPTYTQPEALSQSTALAILLIGLAPWIAVMVALWHVRALFALYRRGHALTEAAALRIRTIGLSLVVAAALGLLAHTAQVLILTGGNPPGQRALSISIGTADVGFVLAGGLMVVIGRAMSEAARAVEDVRSIV